MPSNPRRLGFPLTLTRVHRRRWGRFQGVLAQGSSIALEGVNLVDTVTLGVACLGTTYETPKPAVIAAGRANARLNEHLHLEEQGDATRHQH